jgi:hypothetical protein
MKIDESKKPLYAGGWKPESERCTKLSDEQFEELKKTHAKIEDYQVWRNDADSYVFNITTHVTSADQLRVHWQCPKDKVEELEIRSEGGYVYLTNKGEQFGAYLKLPKKADPNAPVHVQTLGVRKMGCYVVVPKLGAKNPPAELIDPLPPPGTVMKDGVVVDPNDPILFQRPANV